MSRRARLHIGDLARQTGVSVKALRLYDERRLLLVAGRSEANYRLFPHEAVACVQCIRAMQAAGLTLREMQAIASAQCSSANLSELLPQALARAMARLDEQAAQLEAKRARLRQSMASVDATIRQYTA
ncbi:MAG TPA: MerR family transcriptional regulator [Dehalococcoidia bacterium]|nr:MerR family transcriptional regulator [Dehalococcoidia bacterium]